MAIIHIIKGKERLLVTDKKTKNIDFIADVTTSLWTSRNNRKTLSDMFKSMKEKYLFFHKSLLTLNEVGSLRPKIHALLVTNWMTLFRNFKVTYLYTKYVSSW